MVKLVDLLHKCTIKCSDVHAVARIPSCCWCAGHCVVCCGRRVLQCYAAAYLSCHLAADSVDACRIVCQRRGDRQGLRCPGRRRSRADQRRQKVAQPVTRCLWSALYHAVGWGNKSGHVHFNLTQRWEVKDLHGCTQEAKCKLRRAVACVGCVVACV